jgi:hypothetical protein
MKRTLALAATLLAFALPASALEVAGVKFEDRTQLGAAELRLNGAGLRSRLFFKVYAVGLYLPEKKGAAEAVLALKGPKRLHIVTLMEVPAEEFARALVRGVEKNHGEAELAPLKARLEEFEAAILAQKTAAKGAMVALDWLPEGGTRVTFNGKPIGRDMPGEDFYAALLRIWLGARPAQDDLKEALLGKPQ